MKLGGIPARALTLQASQTSSWGVWFDPIVLDNVPRTLSARFGQLAPEYLLEDIDSSYLRHVLSQATITVYLVVFGVDLFGGRIEFRGGESQAKQVNQCKLSCNEIRVLSTYQKM